MTGFWEIVLDIVALSFVTIVSYVVAYRKVRLEHRPVYEEGKEYIHLPKRQDNNMAKELREEYARYNKNRAAYESDFQIELPSTTFMIAIAAICGTAFTVLFGYQHIAGIAQFSIGNRLVSEMELGDAYLGAYLLLWMLWMVFIGTCYTAASAGAKAHAHDYAEKSVRKGLVVRFYQKYSLTETARAIKFLVGYGWDEMKAKRAVKRAKRIKSERVAAPRFGAAR